MERSNLILPGITKETISDITDLKCFEKLAPLLDRLHTVGCERDKAGNRDLHYDELCLLLLLGLFNPVVDGLTKSFDNP